MTDDEQLRAAWRDFCARLARVGDAVLADERLDASQRAEGLHHLTNQLACWATYELGHTDTEHPMFFRSADLVYRWGGPNVDQVARRAKVDGAGRYVVSGTMGAAEDFVLQVKSGAAQTGGADVVAELYASKVGLGPGDDFRILLSAVEEPGDWTAWIALDPATTFVHVRDYYFDWKPTAPATFVIERLDRPGRPGRATSAATVVPLLDQTMAQVERSLTFWDEYQERMRGGQTLNTFGAPGYVARGVQDIVYSHAFVALPPDTALVVELDGAAAAEWGVQVFNRHWYEPLDYANQVTSRNHRQVQVDDDGRVRLVLSPVDPGVANWIDTDHRDEVLVTIRWFRPPTLPEVTQTLVALDDLDEVLPGRTGTVDPSARAAEVAARAAHIAWRFRT